MKKKVFVILLLAHIIVITNYILYVKPSRGSFPGGLWITPYVKKKRKKYINMR